MAEARQRAEWLRIGVAVAWVVNRNGFTREAVSPLKIIPPPFRPPPAPPREKSAEEKAHENELGWRLLDNFFGR